MSKEVESELLTNLQDGVLLLTINRPARKNALSIAIYDDLLKALETASSDDGVGAVVITGKGDAFSAGGDVKRMAGTADPLTAEEKAARLRHRTRIVELLHTMPKPTIAMMRGPAVGAGLSLALACDLRIADTSIRLSTAFIKVGLPGDFGGHYFLPRLVGVAKARELYLTSPMVHAEEALRIGLVNQVVNASELEGYVMDLARGLAEGPRTALACMKANLNDAWHTSLQEMLTLEADRHIRCVETSDHKEALRAFAERRKPNFTSTAE